VARSAYIVTNLMKLPKWSVIRNNFQIVRQPSAIRLRRKLGENRSRLDLSPIAALPK